MKIGVLGTMHSEEIRQDSGLTLEVIKDMIKKFNPDIICGEVRKVDWDQHISNPQYDGYLGPNEYRNMVLPLCVEEKIEFVPVDHYCDEDVKLDYFEGLDEKEIEHYNNEFKNVYTKYMEIGKSSRLPFNSFEFNDFIEWKQNFQGEINPEVHEKLWIERNKIMMENIYKVIHNNTEKKILCLVGAEHVYYYVKALSTKFTNIHFPL